MKWSLWQHHRGTALEVGGLMLEPCCCSLFSNPRCEHFFYLGEVSCLLQKDCSERYLWALQLSSYGTQFYNSVL
jgi:hypothetical protein